jgi:hypothetical protein
MVKPKRPHRCKVKPDPSSLSSDLVRAFYDLDQRLNHDAVALRAAFAHPDYQACFGEDPEVPLRRAKQLERAAVIAAALRLVLERGELGHGQLVVPWRWAARVAPYEPQLHPRNKLAPLKDELRSYVTLSLAEIAGIKLVWQPAVNTGPIRIAPEATMERVAQVITFDVRRARHGRIPKRVHRAARSLAWAVMDGRFLELNRDLSPRLPSEKVVEAVASELMELSMIEWGDVNEPIRRAFHALGKNEKWVRQMFDYRERRTMRAPKPSE